MHIVIATRSCYPHGPTPQRMELFRRVTVPSLLAQTDRDFTWLINCSSREHGEWIADIAGELRLDMRVATDFTNCGEEVRQVRLDDDDALAVDYVARLRAAGPHKPGTWYIFPNGYRIYNGRCQPYNNPANQFIGFDIPNGSPRNVYEINHSKVREQSDFVECDAKAAWLFVRHEQSKSPGGRQSCRQPINRLTGFAVDHEFLAGVR